MQKTSFGCLAFPLLLLLAPAALLAADAQLAAIRLESGRGQIQFEGKPVQMGASIPGQGKLSTGLDGFAQVRFLPSGTLLNVTPGSIVELQPEVVGKPQELALEQGLIRWKIGRKAGPGTATHWRVKSHSATMGVRGTDFMAVSNPLLAESEIIVFEGQVDFNSEIETKDVRKIGAGYWGGVGGRYGQKIGEPIHLSEAALKHFDQATKP